MKYIFETEKEEMLYNERWNCFYFQTVSQFDERGIRIG